MESLLNAHPNQAFEYWFFKVNQGPLALLVDWIARRRKNEYVLRVSIHAPGQRAVLFQNLPQAMISGENFLTSDRTAGAGGESFLATERTTGAVGESFLTTERTAGAAGDVSWDLQIACEPLRVKPEVFPANVLKMFDTAIISAPVAYFTGWIQAGAVRWEVDYAPGMISHYWGRQLSHEWWWLSANQFDKPDVSLECAIFRSGLWGLPLRLSLGYLFLKRDGSEQLLMSPPAAAAASGDPQAFQIQFQTRKGEPILLKGTGREYGDLGDGIINTLVGDLEIWVGDQLYARSGGAACLERRFPEHHLPP